MRPAPALAALVLLACGSPARKPSPSPPPKPAPLVPADPYLAGVEARIMESWYPPAGTGAERPALGCIRLDVEGRVVERAVKESSGEVVFDRSVEHALTMFDHMDQPVPPHLMLLANRGLCFYFVPR